MRHNNTKSSCCHSTGDVSLSFVYLNGGGYSGAHIMIANPATRDLKNPGDPTADTVDFYW